MSAPAISASGLGKQYADNAPFALHKLNLTINEGEIYGFLGPNGAGKTTTIRLLLNFIQPTTGTAKILGRDIVKDSVDIKTSVGYIAGDISLYPKMTGQQFLTYMAQLQPIKKPAYLRDLIKRFNVNTKVKIRALSSGNRQKIAILQAFMHQPKVLILDEPTSGLDPLMQEQFYQLVKEQKKHGSCIFVSSHNLAEVQKMCDRVGFIRDGRLISEQSINEVADTAAATFDITFVDKAPAAELRKIKGAKVTTHTPSHLTVYLRGDLSPLFKILASHRVASISQREINLEEEFLRFYRGSRR